jgi:hypothetical protein
VHKFNNKKLMWFYQAMATDNFMIELKKWSILKKFVIK